MNEEQLQQLILQLAEVQDSNTIVQYMQQLGDQAEPLIELITQRALLGDATAQLAVKNIQLAIQSVSQMAKFGAKLNYIRSLRGQCPDGYEMQYFKQGGPMGTRLCKLCVAKQKKMEESGKAPSNPIDAFKCGRKMKKKENGGNIDFSKCGSKMKKKACGGTVKEAKCGTKMKATCGSKLLMDKCGGKAKKKK